MEVAQHNFSLLARLPDARENVTARHNDDDNDAVMM
jgi:hypothetical protein